MEVSCITDRIKTYNTTNISTILYDDK